MPSDPDLLLKSALAAHRDGRLAQAEAGYREVLAARPGEATALYWLGLLCFHRGDSEEAVRYLRRSLEHAPGHVRGWKDLGGILMASGRLAEAEQAYTRAVEAHPAVAESWYNLGICFAKRGDLEGAVRALRRAIQLKPGQLSAYEPLATFLYQQGDTAGAADVYRQWLLRDPANPKAQHLAAAATGDPPPARASDEYVRAHFNSAADTFDHNLEQLGYRAPQRAASALAALVPAPVPLLLDAGCGTGLAGPLLRPWCRTLIGVDLSSGMLARAAQRGCYDRLIEAELTAFLRSQRKTFDVIICVDTLVYFGALEEPLSAACEALKAGGLLLFTVEAGSGAGHQLQIHGRYAHGEAYLRQAVATAGLKLHSLQHEILREERLSSVAGHLVAARPA